jgi:hypothetical protein
MAVRCKLNGVSLILFVTGINFNDRLCLYRPMTIGRGMRWVYSCPCSCALCGTMHLLLLPHVSCFIPLRSQPTGLRWQLGRRAHFFPPVWSVLVWVHLCLIPLAIAYLCRTHWMGFMTRNEKPNR